MKLHRQPLYYGWIVAGAAGAIGFSNAASAISILTIFVVPMSDEFGWSRTAIAGATTVGAILGAALAPFIGRLVDRVGSRIVLVVSGTVIALACIYLSAMQTLLGFYLAFTASRIADQGGVKIGTSVSMGKWFQRYRGRATGLVFFAETAGVIALAPLTQLVIALWGWRTAWQGLGAVMLLVGVIPCALWMRRQPEDLGLAVDGDQPDADEGSDRPRPHGAGAEEPSLTLKEAARKPIFWMALGALFLGSTATAGPGLHLIPYLTEQGINVTVAVAAISVMSISGAVGALLAGVVADRVHPRWVMISLYLVSAGSLVLLVVTDTRFETFGYAILTGLANTGINTLAPLMWASDYGRGHLGAIHGVGRASQVLGFAVGPLAAGIAYDAAGSYREAFLVMAGITLVAAALLAAARTGPRVGQSQG
ncbi:MAG: MFS transporter [Dehalococcoidia bacterium]|nr:MFS transporter [Dehalococcoidia bacterium]